MTIICVYCGVPFERKVNSQKCCSEKCSCLRIKLKEKEHYQKTREVRLQRANSEEYKLKRKQYQHSDKYRETIRNYCVNRRKNDLNFRLIHSLRSRLNSMIKGKIKSGSAVSDLGCSVEELKHHLEQRFKDGMSWKNYGEWHIDHIRAISKFDLTDRNQLLEACHYTNLQPLWAVDNISKSDS